MTDGIDIDALATAIASKMDPDALMGPDGVAAMLDCCQRQVTENYAKQATFPKPIRLPARRGGRGHPKWRRRDIAEWIAAQGATPKKPGRPRSAPP